MGVVTISQLWAVTASKAATASKAPKNTCFMVQGGSRCGSLPRCGCGAMATKAEVMQAMLAFLESELVEKLAGGGEQAKFSTVAAYLADRCPTEAAWANFGMTMQAWEDKFKVATRAKADHCLTTVPARGEAEEVQQNTEKYRVRLWHLSCAPDACMRGPAPTHNVLKNVERFIDLGCPTHDYPVQVFFDKFGLISGQALPMFKIGICVGTSTVTACCLIAHILANVQSWPRFHGTEDDVVRALGRPFVSIFRITIVDGGSGMDTMGKIQKSLGGKIAASERTRPSPLEMHKALLLRAVELQGSQALRGQDEIWSEVIREFQMCMVGQSYCLTQAEVVCIQLIAKMDQEIRDMLEAQQLGGWGDGGKDLGK